MDNNPTKIIIVDFRHIEEEAANWFGIPLDKLEKRHIKMIKRLFHSTGDQWELAKARVENYG
jgi:hypothetical protein